MKQFTVTDGSNEFIMTLPTKINEITNDYLLDVTKDINIAPYYAVIGVICRCNLLSIVNSSKKQRGLSVSMIPVFVKANVPMETEKPTYDLMSSINCGNKIIISGTDVERAYQLSTPKNFITIDNLVKVYNHDAKFAKDIVLDQNNYLFVDFKLVPITDIKGSYAASNFNEYVNPFITIIKNNGNEVKGN